MNKRTKILIWAAAALILLAGGYFTVTAVQKKTAASGTYEPYDFEYIHLTQFNVLDITRIEIESSGIILEKTGGQWELLSPSNKNIKIEQNIVSDKLWSMSNLIAERIIEEAPDDLSVYGLDAPAGHTIITGINNLETEIFFGYMTPGMNACYTMIKGDPKVYTIYSYNLDYFLFSVDDLRSYELLPNFDPYALNTVFIENNGVKLEIKANRQEYSMIPAYHSFIVTSPYLQPRGTDGYALEPFLEALSGLYIGEFIDDEPVSLSPYGLDKAGRFYIEARGEILDLRFGTGDDGRLYSKLAGSPAVFTVPGLENLINTAPFDIIDKFIMLYFINTVKDFTVTGESRNLYAEIRGTEDAPEFFLNGRKTGDMEFRYYFQAVISLLADAEYPGPQGRTDDSSGLTVTFNFRDMSSLTTILQPYNRDFYSVTQNDTTEFLVSRSQVRNIFEFADRIVYE